VFKKKLSRAYSQRIKTGGRSNCTFQRSPTPPSLLPRGDADTPRRGAENDSGHVRPPRRGEPTPAAVKDFVGLSRPGGNSLEIKGCLVLQNRQRRTLLLSCMLPSRSTLAFRGCIVSVRRPKSYSFGFGVGSYNEGIRSTKRHGLCTCWLVHKCTTSIMETCKARRTTTTSCHTRTQKCALVLGFTTEKKGT
jgi:hypothetical protein